MVRYEDLTGQTFGKLKALSYEGQSRWLCLCECGTKKIIKAQPLKRGEYKSCGCSGKKPKNLEGQVFGEWTVLEKGRSEKKFDAGGRYVGSSRYWLCRCSCGETREVLTHSLSNGSSTSCGHKALEKHHSVYVGESFGLLHVIRTYTPEEGMARAECLCACGNNVEVPIQRLLLGQTKSCGCLRRQASQQRMRALYSKHDMIKGDSNRIRGWKPKELK